MRRAVPAPCKTNRFGTYLFYRVLAPSLCAVLLTLHLPAIIHADETGDRITIVHLVEEANWPPFTPDKFGKVTEGLSYELMRAVFSELDTEIDLELVPQKRMLSYLESGQKDAATVISVNAERSRYLEFSDVIIKKQEFVYYLADRSPPLDWKDFQDLRGLRIGVTAGHNYGDKFQQAAKQLPLTLEEVNSEEQNFKKLLERHIDVLLCNESTANTFLRQAPYLGKIVPASKPYYAKDYHIGFSRKSPARTLIPKVNAAIQELQKDGTLQKILAKYFN